MHHVGNQYTPNCRRKLLSEEREACEYRIAEARRIVAYFSQRIALIDARLELVDLGFVTQCDNESTRADGAMWQSQVGSV